MWQPVRRKMVTNRRGKEGGVGQWKTCFYFEYEHIEVSFLKTLSENQLFKEISNKKTTFVINSM